MTQRTIIQRLHLLCGACATLFAAGAVQGQSLNRPPQDEVFYQIMPIAWRDSDNDVRSGQPARFGDFNGMTASLDYLQGLGITAVYLQPIFPSAAYHGYQHGAADTLNPWFGTQADFQAFIIAAHARGIKVILDYVAYGISQNSVYYTSAHNNPASVYDSYLAFTNAGNSMYTGSSYNTWSGASVGFINWNLNNAGPVGLNTAWARKWLDPNADGNTSDGVDGYRLDHAYSNSPDGGGAWGANISFWQNWCQSLRATKPGVFIFCEPGDWGNYGTDLLTPTGFDGVLTKPFEFAARDAVANANAQELYDSIQSTIAAVPAGKTLVAQVSDHDSDRLASALGGSIPKHKAAAAVLLTQPFPPNIYFGDEIGMRGTTASYGSDANDIPHREPFKWNAVAGPPMSNYFVLNSGAYNGRVEQNNDGRSVAEQQGVAGSLLETYRALIAARRGSIALRQGNSIPVANTSSHVWSFVRQHANQTVLAVHNLSGAAVTTRVNLGVFGVVGDSTVPTDLVSGAMLPPITTANRVSYPLTIPAYSSVIAGVALTAPGMPPAVTVDIDGRNIPSDFGAANLRATQSAPTSLGDNVGELDQLFVSPAADGLRIGITGNIPTDGTALAVWLDTSGAGVTGQNVLNTSNIPAPPAGVPTLAGTRFDAGFAPGHMLFVNCFGGAIYVDHVLLLQDGALKFYRGRGTTNNSSGALTGGSNLTGLAVAVNTTNTGGVTGTSVANAATATAGFELRVPYGDIGLPLSTAGRSCMNVGVAVALVRADGTLSNQVLPGVPATSTADLGAAPNFAAIAGTQWVSVSLPSAADFNGDGGVTVQDIFDFLAAWFASDGHADFNGAGGITVQDIFDFLGAWFAGC